MQQVAATGVVFLGEVARMYEEGYLDREQQISRPTREKETFYLRQNIVPRWGAFRLNQIQPKAIEDWLHTAFESYWTRHGVRAIMGRETTMPKGTGYGRKGSAAALAKRS